jgi:type II secretory pathway pseudopilin PulG
VAGIDSKFFYDRYDNYLNIDANAIVLFDNKGIVLTGWFNPPEFRGNPIGSDIQSIPRFSSLSGSEIINAGFRSHESRDEIISTYQIRGLPYHIAVMHTKKDLLKKWNRETKRDIFIIGITFIIALGTILLGFRQRQKRKKAESRLLQYQLNLQNTVEKRTEELNLTNRDLVQKNEDLEKALAEVKTLSGLLPICSHCKKIRDDKGYWNQIESYIQKHSEAEFSHGICQECAKKYYSNYNLYED